MSVLSHIFFFLCAAIIIYLYGCGGGGSDAGTSSVIISKSHADFIVVDGINGSDNPDYTNETIFKTLSYAITAYQDKDIFPNDISIIVREGIYSEESGEIFPIVISDGINLTAVFGVVLENDGNNLSNMSDVDKLATIIMSGSSSIYNFKIKSKSNGVGVSVKSGSPIIVNNEIIENDVGIVVRSDSVPTIALNIIENNITGIENYDISKGEIFGNEVTFNMRGINIFDSSMPNLGTMKKGGQNKILMNSEYDLCNFSNNTIWAIGNEWDKVTTQIKVNDSCILGSDIGSIFGSAVIYVDLPPEDIQVFGGVGKVLLKSPAIGETLNNNEPSFSWEMGKSNLVALGVFDNRVEVKNKAIVNVNNLMYYWDSGMGRGRIGSVKFSDGRSIVNGEFEKAIDPLPLEGGQTYRWAIWAWDDSGKYITYSSPEGYFTITN